MSVFCKTWLWAKSAFCKKSYCHRYVSLKPSSANPGARGGTIQLLFDHGETKKKPALLDPALSTTVLPGPFCFTMPGSDKRRLGGVIGSHSRLKICRRKSYRFDSGPSHHFVISQSLKKTQKPAISL